jgi:hypothetical protein
MLFIMVLLVWHYTATCAVVGNTVGMTLHCYMCWSWQDCWYDITLLHVQVLARLLVWHYTATCAGVGKTVGMTLYSYMCSSWQYCWYDILLLHVQKLAILLVWHYPATCAGVGNTVGMTLYCYICSSWQDCCRRGENWSWPSVSVKSVDSECCCLNNAIFCFHNAVNSGRTCIYFGKLFKNDFLRPL